MRPILPVQQATFGRRGPAFQAVADDPALTEAALRAFLQTSHEDTPAVPLTPEETGDVAAYVLSLRGWHPGP